MWERLAPKLGLLECRMQVFLRQKRKYRMYSVYYLVSGERVGLENRSNPETAEMRVLQEGGLVWRI